MNRVAKTVGLLLSTGNWHHWHWIIWAFLRGKIIVFIFLSLLLANCLVPSALSNLKSCTNMYKHTWWHWHRQLTLTIFGTLFPRLRNRDLRMRQERHPTLRVKECQHRRRRMRLKCQRSRNGGNGRVEQAWGGGVEAVTLQQGEDSRHHPEGRRRRL